MNTDTQTNTKIRTGKESDFRPIVFRVKTVPADQIKQKFARNRNILTCRSWFDHENKTINYEHMENATDSVIKSYSFDDICKDFGWQTFDFENDYQTIIPTWCDEDE